MRLLFPALLLSACTGTSADKDAPLDTGDTGDTAEDTADETGEPEETGDSGETAEPPVDADEDGHAADVDCDDADPAINPAATEMCDGVDNDCDSLTDEDAAADASTYYYDNDGDGYGDPAISATSCAQHEGYVPSPDDCDDADPASYPGAAEVPGDGLDQNCDGADASGSVEYGWRSGWTGSYGYSSPGQYILTNVEIAAPMTITHLGTTVSPSSGLFHFVIYEDSGGTAGALLGGIYGVTLALGDNEIALSKPITVGAGTVWVGLVNEGDYSNGYISSPGMVCIELGVSFADPLLDPFPEVCYSFSVQVVMWVRGY